MRHRNKSARRFAYLRPRRGATLADVCVVAAVAVLALVAVLPALAAVQADAANRIACASNLRKIAVAAFAYSNADVRSGGKFPRLHYNGGAADKPSLYTGVDAAKALDIKDPRLGGPADNEVVGAFYHLLKTQKLDTALFVCPSGDAKPLAAATVPQKSNFPGRANLSYSYNNPYPAPMAVAGGWRFDNSLGPDYPLAADMNPGDTDAGGPTKVAPTSDRKLMATANSRNHQSAGQNVAYCDAHVEWQATPFCGARRRDATYRDNVYAAQVKVDAAGKGGVVLAPAQDAQDAVLLPAYADGPQPGGSPARADGPPAGADPARARFDAALAAARAGAERATAAAAAEYRAGLKTAMSEAMRAEDLAEANRVKAAMDGVGGSATAPANPPAGPMAVAARRAYESAVARAEADAVRAVEVARTAYLAEAGATPAASAVRGRPAADLLRPAPARRPVVAFGKTKYLDKVLPAIAEGSVRHVDRGRTVAAMNDPATYAGGPVVVWNQNHLRDTPAKEFTPAVLRLMQAHVRDGGDLVIFEQFEAGNMRPIDAAFGMRTTGGAPGGDFVDPDMAAQAKAAGVTGEDADKLPLWNEYYDLPPTARVLVRARRHKGAADPAGIAVVPFGKGRLVLVGMEAKPFKTLDALFAVLYGYAPSAE